MSNIPLRSHAGENISELLYANEAPVFLLIMTHNCRLVLKTCDVIMATTKCQSIQANPELSSSHAQAVRKKNTATERRVRTVWRLLIKSWRNNKS